jgi:diaminopimelate epimerase
VALLAELSFTKGHGTANDFILISDVKNEWIPTVPQITWLCDRRRGVGADGVIRIVPTALVSEFADLAIATWFMDYRNSDGSIAEMCGNGARVFARYLVASGLETKKEFVIATRAGLHQVEVNSDFSVSISMGVARKVANGSPITVTIPSSEVEFVAAGVYAPNPHAVVCLPENVNLNDIELGTPQVNPSEVFPDGVNIEFVKRMGPNHVAMRVVERGSGETMSCGTGACAVAWVEMLEMGVSSGEVRVDVPGGTLWVSLVDQQLWLRGSADLVARGKILLPPELL